MNKSKKELYEENKKLRKTIKTYGEFWETDAIEECTKQMMKDIMNCSKK